jgi:hypothetical protein
MGQPIAWCDAFTDSGQAPVAQPEAVHPIGFRHPREIATARAVMAGQLSITIRELWNEPVWWQLAGVARTQDIVSVYEAMAAMPSSMSAQMLIKPPGSSTWRGKNYHGLVITSIPDGEEVTIGAMTFPRTIVAWYTHATPVNVPAGAA